MKRLTFALSMTLTALAGALPLGVMAATPESNTLQFVPAIISPNLTLHQDRKNPVQDISGESPPNGDIVTLEGVSPQKTLSQLRQAPRANTAALAALSMDALTKQENHASLSALSTLQAEISETDLKRLWQATIEHNQIVRFALEKISLPAEHHVSHSSEFLRKTLSVLVSGAAMASTAIAPTSGYQNMTVLTGSQVAQNYIGNRHKPLSDLSPTEHIQLSYLIDELKEGLVTHYHQYQQAVYALTAIRKTTATEEADYLSSKAADSPLARMMGVQRYYTYRENLLKAETRAEQARIQLERLAGAQAVDNLALGVRPEASYVALNTPDPVVDPQTPRVIAKDASGDIQLEGQVVGAAASIAPLQKPPSPRELSLADDLAPSLVPTLMNGEISHKAAHRLTPKNVVHQRDSKESALPSSDRMELPLMEDVSL